MANSAFNQNQTPFASETAAGTVEEATTAQVDAATDVGETGAKLFVPPSKLSQGDTVNLFLADETITAGDAVALKLQTTTPVQTVNQTLQDTPLGYNLVNNLAGYAMPFTASALAFRLKKITLKFNGGSQAGGAFQIQVRATPNGASLYTYTTHTYGASEISEDIKDNIALAITPGATYYVTAVQTVSPGSGTEDRRRQIYATNTINAPVWESSDGGTTYINSGTRSLYLKIEEDQYTGLEKVVKASATSLNEALNFVGFAKNSVTAGQVVNIDFSTIVSPASGSYTTGATYYLSNTAGQVSLAPGTIIRIIGKAVSTSKLLRKRGPVSKPINSNSGTASPVDAIYQVNAGGVSINVTVDGQVYNTNGIGVMVPRGAPYSVSAQNGYLVIMDYGSVI